MKIAITSRIYFPSHGGVPVYTRLLGNAFHELGHEVRLFTSTQAESGFSSGEKFQVIRGHQTSACMGLARWCDVLLQVELSVGLIWPFLLFKRPCFISHHTHFAAAGGPDLFRRVHGWVASQCHPIAVSDVLKKSWGGHGVVIGNPYDDGHFFPGDSHRNQELLFVGRLVPDKGCDVLLKALVRMREMHLFPRLVIIGDDGRQGVTVLPEWEKRVAQMGLADQVAFLGAQPVEAVAQAMRTSQILVIPSTWQEPFGIVGLEGLASGCKVVASRDGGLKEACGEFATYFDNGSDESLAIALQSALLADGVPCSPALAAHLEAHRPLAVAERYMDHFIRGCESI